MLSHRDLTGVVDLIHLHESNPAVSAGSSQKTLSFCENTDVLTEKASLCNETRSSAEFVSQQESALLFLTMIRSLSVITATMMMSESHFKPFVR